MPLPTTDEDLIINGLGGGATLQNIFDRLQTLIDVIRQTNSIPAASILSTEFFNRGGSGDSVAAFPPSNNSIYGTEGGFQLDESDSLFPLVLESVHANARFEHPPIVITFSQYLATLA